MRVSVVLCTYSMEMYDHFRAATESVLGQSHDDVELVVVVDGTDAVFERVREDYCGREDVVLHCNDGNRGLLASRNTGADLATGDVVAFIDDDAVADEDWVAELVGGYEDHPHDAVGGKMVPGWVAGEPEFLPAEFYWLVGVTHRGFAEGPGEVRNTFGSNISFRRETFHELGGFDTDIGGRKGDRNLQGGETELCARLRERTGRGVWYVPDAEVTHKVFDYRTEPRWLAERAFWQGYSKRAMEVLVPESSDEEEEFLGRLLTESLPGRLWGLLTAPSGAKAKQLVALVVLTGLAGVGYLYGITKWR
jgi:GT2 family glycosyltransferase